MLLSNSINNFKITEDIVKGKINLNIDNAWQMILLSIVIIGVVVKYSKAFYASDVELFLSKSSKAKKKELSTLVVLFLVIAFCNELFILQKTFIFCAFILFILALLFYIILCIKVWWQKRKGKDINKLEQKKQDCILFFIIVAIPLLISGLSIVYNKSKISLAILGTLVETILIFLSSNGFKRNRSDVKIINFDNEKEKYYLLEKIDDKKILCGDKKTIKESSKLVTIDVEDILNKKYYIVLDKK